MEPIEINAGSWYLRALRADERIDDRPALAAGGIIDPDYVATRAAGWRDESVFAWAVCEPTTAELVAEVTLTPAGDGTAQLDGWSRAGHDAALAAGSASVRRFAEGALELHVR